MQARPIPVFLQGMRRGDASLFTRACSKSRPRAPRVLFHGDPIQPILSAPRVHIFFPSILVLLPRNVAERGMAVRRDDDEELRDVLANDVTILSDELARWPALIARVASFLFNSLKIFTLTE